MNRKLIFAVIYFFSTICFGQGLKLLNGHYFVEGKFVLYDVLYVNNGQFTFKKPKAIDREINLQNKYIIPPFAEGHTHKMDNPLEFPTERENFLAQGVFYIFVLNNFSSNVERNRSSVKFYNDVEVLYANGGITASGQHPSFVYERIHSKIKDWWLPVNTAKIRNSRKAEMDAYWFMDNIQAVDKQWKDYLKTKPDFVKIYLMNAKNNGQQNPKSLSESVVNYIVKKARNANLRVIGHIETLDDLKIGLRCGISIYGHLPSYNVNFSQTLPDEITFSNKEKALIKKLKPIIIPTLSFNEEFSIVRNEKNNYQGELDSANFTRSVGFQKHSIAKLKENGFTFAIGSDRDLFLPELLYWCKYDIFTRAEIFTIATKITPQVMFPKRKIGEIKEGFEASFLVLNSNPLLNIEGINQISLKIKQGRIL